MKKTLLCAVVGFGSLIGMDYAAKPIMLLASEQLLPIIFKATEAPTLEQEIKNYGTFLTVSKHWHGLLTDQQTVGSFLELLGRRYNRSPYEIALTYQDRFPLFKQWITQKNATKDTWLHDADELFAAIDEPDTVKLRELLRSGRDPNPKDPTNVNSPTPLCYAVTREQVQATQMLLDFKANPNIPITSTGWTPLLMAVKKQNPEITKRLLQAGANPNMATIRSGSTPLMVAADTQNPQIVSLLLTHGANKNIRNNHNLTALDIARRKGNPKIISLLTSTNKKEITNEE